ncbi:hypothetical protein D3C73_874830 [compost metagenome]
MGVCERYRWGWVSVGGRPRPGSKAASSRERNLPLQHRFRALPGIGLPVQPIPVVSDDRGYQSALRDGCLPLGRHRRDAHVTA